jgi:hypothetical protein
VTVGGHRMTPVFGVPSGSILPLPKPHRSCRSCWLPYPTTAVRERSEDWDPMVRVTRYSDNAAANELLEQTGGSDADGAADMVERMKSLGLTAPRWPAAT